MSGPEPGKCEDCGKEGPRVEVPWAGITATNEGKSVCIGCAPSYVTTQGSDGGTAVPRPSGVEEPVWNNQCCRCLRVGVGERDRAQRRRSHHLGVHGVQTFRLASTAPSASRARCRASSRRTRSVPLGCRQKRDSDRLVEALASVEMPAVALVLNCPACGERHVDEGVWATKLHHTHACQICGLAWRPAIVFTVGVQFLPGFKSEG